METLKTLAAKCEALSPSFKRDVFIREYKDGELLANRAKRAVRYRELFAELAAKPEYKDVVTEEHACGYNKGDLVCMVNPQGVAFPNCTILGFEGDRAYLDIDCYWYSISVSRLIKQDNAV